MNRRLLASTTAVLALGGFLAACGDDKMSRDEFVETAVEDGGLTEDQANCVFDELGDDAEEFLGQDADDASEEDMQRFTEAVSACISSSISIPEISMPDFSVPDLSIPDLTVPEGVTVP
jgi:hypothetical protein